MGRPREFDEDEVTRTAISIFGQYGFDALSIDTLLSKIGVNRASFYKLYGSKHGLARVALEHVCEQAANNQINQEYLDFTVVALVELANVNAEFHSLISTAVGLCFEDNPTKLGQQILRRANIKINKETP